MELIHLVYSSVSTDSNLSQDDLESILEQSRRNNEKVGITGILLYHAGSFFQVLEGQKDIVEAVYTKISKDERHSRVKKIVSEPIEERDFGEWTMGYPKLSQEQLENVPGMNDFFNLGNSFSQLSEGRSKNLLSAFRKGKWHANP